ncbi:MAG: hypothetical protein WAQ05_24110, partial [Rubrivivax sp.]
SRPVSAAAHNEEKTMATVRLVAILAIVAGVLGLIYGGFSYTQEKTAAKLGPVELKVEETKNINVPVWAGVAAVVAGGLVLIGTARKSR